MAFMWRPRLLWRPLLIVILAVLVIAVIELIVIRAGFAAPGVAVGSLPPTLGFAVALYMLRARRACIRMCGQPKEYSDNDGTHYRVVIFTDGPAVAENVQLLLIDITPSPLDPGFRRDFPYVVARAGYQPDPARIGCKINPKERELFEVMRWWRSGGGQMMVHGFDTKSPIQPLYKGLPSSMAGSFEVHSGEHWQLQYRASAANARPLEFTLTIRADNQAVRVGKATAAVGK
jgi:hypothetical protein